MKKPEAKNLVALPLQTQDRDVIEYRKQQKITVFYMVWSHKYK
jgi:hypothetical protein